MEAISFEGSKNGIERRGDPAGVPFGIESRLTVLQRLALSRFSNFGWSLAFIRQLQGDAMTVVVRGPDGAGHAILTEEGDLDRNTELTVRA